MKYLILYYVIISVVLFVMMWLDKQKAIKGRSRIPEAYLFIAALLGGAIGGFIGMFACHHKTKKIYFYFIYFLAFNLHLVFFYTMMGKLLFQN